METTPPIQTPLFSPPPQRPPYTVILSISSLRRHNNPTFICQHDTRAPPPYHITYTTPKEEKPRRLRTHIEPSRASLTPPPLHLHSRHAREIAIEALFTHQRQFKIGLHSGQRRSPIVALRECLPPRPPPRPRQPPRPRPKLQQIRSTSASSAVEHSADQSIAVDMRGVVSRDCFFRMPSYISLAPPPRGSLSTTWPSTG